MPPNDSRDAYANAPQDELGEPVLPRWFVLVALVSIPAAAIVTIVALTAFGPREVPLIERRPPPGDGLTHAVGEWEVGELPSSPYDAPCPHVDGVGIAGSDAGQRLLREALAGLCNVELPAEVRSALADFAQRGGVVRFAVFEVTGVDSAAELESEPPRILVNARFTQLGRARWIAPLVAHDAVMLAGVPHEAATALAARRAEALVCERLVGTGDRSRGCDDAAAIVDLDDPLAALREAGYR